MTALTATVCTAPGCTIGVFGQETCSAHDRTTTILFQTDHTPTVDPTGGMVESLVRNVAQHLAIDVEVKRSCLRASDSPKYPTHYAWTVRLVGNTKAEGKRTARVVLGAVEPLVTCLHHVVVV